MSFLQNPELVNSPLTATECPKLAAGTLGLPVVNHASATLISPPPAQKALQRPRPLPGPGVAAELVHVGVVLGQDGDGVTLLPNDEPGLLLRGTPQVYAIELGNTQSGVSDRQGWERGGHGSSMARRQGGREESSAEGQLPLTSSN